MKTSVKITSCETWNYFYGINKLARNAYAKNKKCYKLLVLIDSKRKPIYFKYFPGNVNDSKILNTTINDIIQIIKNKCEIILADSGFCSANNRKLLIDNNILC